MPFLNQFRKQVYPDWATDYVTYESISQGLEINNWTDKDELDFQSAIQLEFEKVDLFITKQEREIQTSISYFDRFDKTNSNIFETVLKLKHYIRSNYQALEELIYQHDEIMAGRKSLRSFFTELNRKYRLDTQRLSPLLLQLEVDNSMKVDATYWVDQSCVNEIKSILLFHLPLTKTIHRNQTYFDNVRFQSYIKNCQYDKDAELILFEAATSQDSINVIKRGTNGDEERIIITRNRFNEHLHNNDLEPKLQLEFEQSIFSEKEELEEIIFENEIVFMKKDEDDSILQSDGTNEEKYKFPYAVLTIKSTRRDVVPWLLELLTSNLVYPVPCYSSVLHGISHFWNLELPILPIWRWIHTDESKTIIDYQRKLITDLNQIAYLEKQLNKQNQMEDKEKEDLNINRPSTSSGPDQQEQQKEIKELEQEDDERTILTIEDRRSSTTLEPNHSSDVSIAHIKSDNNIKARRKSSFVEYYDPEKAISNNQIQSCNDFTIQIEGNTDEAKLLRKQKKEKKKAKKLKEALKLTEHTIEPKLFFANERTFINWLQFSALILTGALTLLNFGDMISQISGAVFLGVSLVLALYAFFRYRYRAYQMSNTPHDRYDDIYGPAGLTALILGATALNFVLRWEHPPVSSSYLGINNQTQQQNSS